MLHRLAGAVLVAALAATGLAAAGPAEAAAKTYKNCTALNKVYKHGVARKGASDKVRGSTRPVTTFTVSTAVYNANKKSDRDKDGVACEKR
ncbi:excalibur calcium-binding domain-containing protein [Symbioplanes lichenis]|uniref:excalibur calcium-binding domain-containing protein n=1 Tax=Symbioplanes lichenis TaxID=1629072 RepID=UPI00273A106B|nr:excalibur calcium-binding domain-containing protein [Actinoplanes lichenis]